MLLEPKRAVIARARRRPHAFAGRAGGGVTKRAGNTGLLTDASASGECWLLGSHSWKSRRQPGSHMGWVLAEAPPPTSCVFKPGPL